MSGNQLSHPAVKSAFSLDRKFFVDLRARLELERGRANEQHNSIIEWLRKSIDPPDGYGITVNSPEVLHPPETIPPVEELALLVEAAFWASLEREEGRPLHFTLNFMMPEPSGDRLITFSEPLPYDVRGLTKLAPAVGTTKAALLVGAFGKEGLKIWGRRGYSKGPLAVRVIDPGSVVVKFNETNVAAISRSEAVHIRDPLLTRNSAIWSRFAGEEGEQYDQWRDPRINAILETVKRMRAIGHGGTLLVVPRESRWQESVKTPIAYASPEHYSPFREPISKLREIIGKPGHTWMEEMYWWTGVNEACQTLSQMTAVDGATIITYDLDVVGFGAKLREKPGSVEPPIIYNVDPLDHKDWIVRVKLGQLGGTRHQSAARFVADQQESIAFVVSQDGDVSAFVWWRPPHTQAALYAHRRLELTLF